MGYDADVDKCDIKYTDYGGYDTVPASDLKQIRTDFLTLPFQVMLELGIPRISVLYLY